MLIEMLAQCRSFSSRRQYIYTPKQQQQTWKKPCGRFYFPNTAKICSSLLYDLDTTHTGRSSPCTWSFVSTYGRCDDSIFHIGKLHSNLPKNRCLDMVDIIRFGGNRIVCLDWQSLFRSALRSFSCHQRKCRHRVDKVEEMQGVDFS